MSFFWYLGDFLLLQIAPFYITAGVIMFKYLTPVFAVLSHSVRTVLTHADAVTETSCSENSLLALESDIKTGGA